MAGELSDRIDECECCPGEFSCFLPAVLSGGGSLIFFERADKIAQVIEAAAQGNARDGIVRGGQGEAGVLDSLNVQVLDGRVVRHLVEEAAEVFG